LRSVRYFDRPFYWLNRITLGLARLIDTLLIYPWVAARELRRERPELLVCMNSIPEGLAARAARVPYMVSVRGDVPAELRPRWLLERPMRALERSVLRQATRVLANGFDTQARLRENGIESVVVPNGVDLGRFRLTAGESKAALRLQDAASGRPVISVVGTMRPIKGTDDAIACAVELQQAGTRFLMALVGKGEQRRYRRAVQSTGVEDVVLVLGETRDVPAILRHTDVFLALSGGSGMSMAVLEAMAAGVAVVALDTPVYRQLITHDQNGVLAAPTDVAAGCLRLLRDAELRKRLGDAGAVSAAAYGWDRVAERFIAEVTPASATEVAV
jgi:glycosyltransferase involved in cell wall biosynthesis